MKTETLILIIVFLKETHVAEAYYIPGDRRWTWTNLVLGVALVQQHIHDWQLLDIAVSLELLADLRADGGYRHAEGVHGLDLGGLYSVISG